MLLPFVFIFDSSLLLIGKTGTYDIVITIIMCSIGIMIFSSSLQGYFVKRNTHLESGILLITSLILLFPSSIQKSLFPKVTPVHIQDMKQVIVGDALNITVHDKIYGTRVVRP